MDLEKIEQEDDGAVLIKLEKERYLFSDAIKINSNSKIINLSFLPVSSVGLSVGDLWNDGGIVKVKT